MSARRVARPVPTQEHPCGHVLSAIAHRATHDRRNDAPLTPPALRSIGRTARANHHLASFHARQSVLPRSQSTAQLTTVPGEELQRRIRIEPASSLATCSGVNGALAERSGDFEGGDEEQRSFGTLSYTVPPPAGQVRVQADEAFFLITIWVSCWSLMWCAYPAPGQRIRLLPQPQSFASR